MTMAKISQQILSAVAVTLLLATHAFALDLSGAKLEGLVGETSNGYIAAIKPSGDVNALVEDINNRRKAHYLKIATKNNLSLEAIEVRAGQKAISKTPAGQFVDAGDGWTKK
jgi:uncharacterized protein YdbL (DUF1318 family)